MTLTPESPDRADRALDVLGVVTLLVTLGLLVLAAVTVPFALDVDRTTEEVREAAAVEACVSQTRSAVIVAMADVTSARARLGIVTNEGLEASIRGDDAALAAAVQAAPDARADLLDALTGLDAATSAALDAAGRAVEDPAVFLAECRGG